MRTVARRFGMGSGVALLVLVATGVAMASHFDRGAAPCCTPSWACSCSSASCWRCTSPGPGAGGCRSATLVASLAIVWLGVELAHG